MNRRSFLSLLGLGTVGALIDPERLLWTPGAKTIFIPEIVRVRGTNLVLTHGWITREALKALENNLRFSACEQWYAEGQKIGSVVNVRQPARFRTDIMRGFA